MKIFRNILLAIMTLSLIVFISSFGFGLKGKNLEEFFTASYLYEKADTVIIDDMVNELNIDVVSKNIKITIHEFDYVMIDYYQLIGKDNFSVQLENSIINILEKPVKKWVNFQITKKEVKEVDIKLPKDAHINLNINNITGTINLSEINFNKLNIINNTGNIYIKDIEVVEDLIVKVDTGNINMENIQSKNINVKTETGRINLKNQKTNSLVARASTGNIEISFVDSSKIELKTNTGKINIIGDYSKYNYDFQTDTGRITINGIKVAGKFDILNTENAIGKITARTNTGNIVYKSIV